MRPEYPYTTLHLSIGFTLCGSTHDVKAWFEDLEGEPGFLRLCHVDVFEKVSSRAVWSFYPPLEDERLVYDFRSGDGKGLRSPLTEADVDLDRCAIPAFGEYEETIQKVRTMMRVAGYGELE